jgi:hypothetical protein
MLRLNAKVGKGRIESNNYHERIYTVSSIVEFDSRYCIGVQFIISYKQKNLIVVGIHATKHVTICSGTFSGFIKSEHKKERPRFLAASLN